MTAAADQQSYPPAVLSRPFARRPILGRAVVVVAVFSALALWALVIRLPSWSVEGSDDAFFVAVAHLWMRGALPYVGAFDIKPPGFFAILVGAEALFGASLQTLKAVLTLFDAIAATALYFIGARMGSRAIGLFAALLYPFLSEAVTNNPAYAPLAAFTTLAFLAVLSPLAILERAALAGLAIGAAVAVKQTAAFEAIALLAIVLRAPEAASRRLAAGLAFGLAAAVAPLGFLLYFAAHGAAGAMIADVVGDALLRPSGAFEHMSFIDGLLRSLVYLVKPIAPILLLACLALLRRRVILAAAPNAAIAAIGWWAAASVISVWAQHALFRAYLGPTLAPFSLLAGACAVFAAPELAGLAIALRLALIGLATFVAVMVNRGVGLDRVQETHALAVVAEAIRASQPAPDDKLFVVSRGMWLYTATGLSPPTAYFHWEHTLCDFPGAGPGRLAEALATQPRFVVVASGAHAMCELADSWRQIDAALARSYRLLAHARGDNDSYDVYQAASTPAR
jgi:hypothetical protein